MGTDRKMWKFYDSINDILGNWPATYPPVVIDTLDQTTLTDGGEDSHQDDDPVVSEEIQGDTEGSSAVESSNVENASCSRSSTPVKMKEKPNLKRKRSKGEVVEDVMSKVMTTVTEGLKENDKMFLELEENWLRFEEQKRRGNYNCRWCRYWLDLQIPTHHLVQHNTTLYIHHLLIRDLEKLMIYNVNWTSDMISPHSCC